MAQAAHAAFEFSRDHPDVVERWLDGSNYLIIVSVEDEIALMGVIEQARALDCLATAIREPDIGDELTCVALEPGVVSRGLCSGMPLALRDVCVTDRRITLV